MALKRRLDAVVPEQEAAQSPRKRLRRAVFILMFLDRSRARAVTVERMVQMVRQMQLDMAKLFVLLMVLVLRLGSMESLLLHLPNMVRGIVAEQLDVFHSSLMVSMEDMMRSVRQTEMQETQVVSLRNSVYEPSSSRAISEGLPETGSSSGVVKLRFIGADRPKDPLFTSCPVKWQNGQNPKVAIFRNEKQITGGDLSKLQIEIVPVYADFFTERGQEDFTEDEFNKHIHMCKGKESVLETVILRNGEADLGSIIFTETSHLKKLRLAARVKRQDRTLRVQEAITDPFVVKDRRSESNEKSNLPSKGDAVHTLKRISHKRFTTLQGENITTVKHLMRQYHKDKSALQKLTGMKEEFSTMIKHAATCDPGDEIYSYRVAEENCELLFNDFFNLVGTMINGSYVLVSELNQLQQLKVNNWKKSAYKKFEEQENLGGLVPDYVMCKITGGPMINGRPVCAVPLNNDAGPSVQATTTWPYPNNMAAQEGASLIRQQNGYLSSSTTDARELGQHDPSMPQNGTSYYPTQENILNGQAPFSGQPTVPSQNFLPSPEDDLIPGGQQNGYLNSLITDAPELGQHHPCMSQNGTPYYLTQRNILNDQGSFSGQSTIPSHSVLPVRDEVLIAGASSTDQQNEYLNSLMTDAPGISCPVTDGLSQGTSSFNHAAADIWSGLSQTEVQEFLLQADLADQGFIQANDAELLNSNIQFDGYEHDGGNL